MDYSVYELISRKKYRCECGREHAAHLKEALVDFGAAEKCADYVKKYNGTKAYILADENTFAAAGEKVTKSLEASGIPYVPYIYGAARIEPDEKAVGAAVLNFPYDCDILIAIGSGVLNDIGKIVAKMTSLPYIIVGTAPSMDGFASSTSSVIRGGLKVSVDSKCPDVILGDLDVLCAAPIEMIRSGLGDMLAKYVSVCEWRIGRLVTNEYYCEEVAAMIRSALKKCADNASGILTRDPAAVKAVMEGLILSGIAADYAGVSRPVSGVEHYYSHLWDMRALEFGTPWSLHGIQCGIGTAYAAEKYERLASLHPDREKAMKNFDSFDKEAWFGKIKEYLGASADAILASAPSSDRYDAAKHEQRLDNILNNWDAILRIVREEMPDSARIRELLRTIGAPENSAEIGIPTEENDLTFRMTKDIRDKYILSTLLWDIGEEL